MSAVPQHQGDGDGRKRLHHGVVQRVGEDGVLEGLHVLPVDGLELLVGALLAVEQLQGDDAAYVLLQKAVDACDGRADAAVAVAHGVAEDLRGHGDQWQHDEGRQRQPPILAQHDADDEQQHEDVFHNADDATGEHLVYGVHVGRHTGHQAAHGIVVEEGDVHALQVPIELAAKVEHHHLPGPLHQVGLGKLKAEAHHQHAQVQRANLRDAGHRHRAQVAVQPGVTVRVAGQVVINGQHGQKRTEHIRQRLQDDGHKGHQHLQGVGAQVAHQATGHLRIFWFCQYFFFCGHCSLLSRSHLRLRLSTSLDGAEPPRGAAFPSWGKNPLPARRTLGFPL